MDELVSEGPSISEGLEKAAAAPSARKEADHRIEAAVASKRLVLTGAPDGYTICVYHGIVPGIDPDTGDWLRGGGSCGTCLKTRREEIAALAAEGGREAPGSEVAGAQLATDSAGMAGRGALTLAGTRDFRPVQAQARLDPVGGQDVLGVAPAPAGDGADSGADPWDDVFGFPARELRP